MKFQIGDRVKVKVDFLRSIGCYTGPLPFARGTVTKRDRAFGALDVVCVEWDQRPEWDNDDLPNKFISANLTHESHPEREKPVTDIDAKKLESELEQFIGTETWFRHPYIRRILWTDGVEYLHQHTRCFWLIDSIAIDQAQFAVKREKFQEWKLVRDAEGNGATLTCEDGNGNRVLRRRIDYTDFPLKEIRLWFCDNVLMLPSEY